MALRLVDAKPLLEPMLIYCHLDCQKQRWMKFNQNTILFIQENASENIVCEVAAILSRARWVNIYDIYMLRYMLLQYTSKYCGCWWPGTLPYLRHFTIIYIYVSVGWNVILNLALMCQSYVQCWRHGKGAHIPSPTWIPLNNNHIITARSHPHW